MAKMQTGLRVEPESLERLDVIAAALSTRAGGLDVSRTDAARVAIRRGIEVLEAELGIVPQKKESKPASKPAKKTTPKK